MTSLVEQCVAALLEAGAVLTPGLTDEEVVQLQVRWEIEFSSDHAAFLQRAVPLGEGWVDWRGAAEPIAQRLRLPAEGLLHDVEHNAFWPASWGPRQADQPQALEFAAHQLASWPRLVPLYGHRYLPAGPLASPSPVLSVMQSDVIYYGFDLLEWVRREFFGVQLPPVRPTRPVVRYWTSLAEGCEDCDL